jgi:hypothetical protein
LVLYSQDILDILCASHSQDILVVSLIS